MEYLPQETSLDIFSRLPLGSLFHYRHVCRAWRSLVQHPSLLSLHSARHDSHTNPSLIFLSTKLYYFELLHIHDAGDELKLSENIKNIPFKSKINVPVNDVISCNGLLFLYTSNVVPSPSNFLSRFLPHRLLNPSNHHSRHEQIFIYNPLTGEFNMLLDRLLPKHHYSVYGFGFHSITNEYKVVRIVNIDNDQHIEVCTLGTNKWRIKKTRPYYMHRSTKVSVNGAFHWVAKTQWPQKAGLHPIVSFDLLDEKIYNVPSPDCSLDFERYSEWVVLGGCLCIVNNVHIDCAHIWATKDYGGNRKWLKEYSIVSTSPNIRGPFSPLCLLRNGRILFQTGWGKLVCYDIVRKRCTYHQIKKDWQWISSSGSCWKPDFSHRDRKLLKMEVK